MNMIKHWRLCSVLLVSLALTSCGDPGQEETESATSSHPVTSTAGLAVTADRLRNAASETGNWLSHGRTYDEQRFSPLEEINPENIGKLGLAWYFDIPTRRGMEATPIVVDGRMFVTGSWSIVYALDAATGDELWRFDPQVSREWAQYLCCDVVNRGVAVWKDSVLVGTLDGYLISIDAQTGKENWRVDTINRKPPYSITGAPRVIDGIVVIGNGGADYGVRGYITGYDADTGAQKWRFHTVPGNPAEGYENEAMKKAAETWTGEWWNYGGGGTAWDSMAYDPELDLLYVGTGNGSPWNRKIRSPEGGDNLYLSSIIALRPSTGEYVWHYQTTPGDSWDFTATQHIILADLEIQGRNRKVLMQAPKNGFFYVLDRTSGELISAESYVPVNWASGIDPETGRPIETENARYDEGPFLIFPSPLGGHNWHPMSYSPNTGLVYLPAQEIPFIHGDPESFEVKEGFWNTGTKLVLAAAPDDPETMAQINQMIRGQLVAWDPIQQREVWRYQHVGPWNGGVLATAGNLVFQGSLVGEFAAYDANNGKRLWSFPAQTGVAAGPVSYIAGDAQHVAVAAGWGSIFALLGGESTAALNMRNQSRILAFRLDGKAQLPPEPAQAVRKISPPQEFAASEDQLERGKENFFERCGVCHGDGAASGGITPDLRYASAETHAAWNSIVLGGALRPLGMPGFAGTLTETEVEEIRLYVLDRARLEYQRQNSQ
jgi:PQQ-dependent dehydrogenase (methanol/ethanol family)